MSNTDKILKGKKKRGLSGREMKRRLTAAVSNVCFAIPLVLLVCNDLVYPDKRRWQNKCR